MTKHQRIVVGLLAALSVILSVAIVETGVRRRAELSGVAGTYVASLANNVQGQSAPYTSAETVSLGGGAGVDWTPTKAVQTRSLYIGGTGNVKVDMADGTTGVVFSTVPVGELRLSVTKVYSSADGTSATTINALY